MQPGDRLGRYRILRRLGQGGMGVVYAAEETAHGRCVALKVLGALDAHNPLAVARFQREGAAVARLRHPGIVRVFEAGQVGRSHFIAMELVEGSALDTEIRRVWDDPKSSSFHLDMDLSPGDVSSSDVPTGRGAGELKRLVEWCRDCAEALHAAHRAGVLHRDFKPGNVLIDREGRAKLVDFGLAHSQGNKTLTRTGDLLGTPSFMSPELLRGERSDHRTDVYALGVTLYLAVTDHLPHAAANFSLLMRQILEQEPVRPSHWNPALPSPLQEICHRALARNPTHRYLNARRMAQDLDRYLLGKPLLEDYATPMLHRVARVAARTAVTVVTTGIATLELSVRALLWICSPKRQGARRP